MDNWINYLAALNLFLLIVGLCYRIGFKKNQNYRFGRPFLIIGMLSSFLFPLIDLSIILKNTSTFISNDQWLEPISISPDVTLSLNSQLIMISIVLIGISLKFIQLVVGIIKIEKLKNQSNYFKEYFQIPNSTDAFSFLNSIFIGENIESSKRTMIIQHEKVHIQKRHYIDVCITEILKTIFWFNPILYVIQNDLKELHEFEADDNIEINPKAYIDLLLQQSFSLHNYSFVNQFNSNHIKNRIMRIKNRTKRPIKKSAIVLTATFLAAGIAFSQNDINSKKESLVDFAQLNKLNALGGLNQLNKLGELNQLGKLNISKNGEVNQKAEFPGGMNALAEFMGKNVKYPKTSKKEGQEGTVFISFKIDVDGSCSDFVVKKGINDQLDKAAINGMKQMPKWNPAKKDGKAVASKMVLPVKFALPQSAPEPPTAPKAPKAPEAPRAK